MKNKGKYQDFSIKFRKFYWNYLSPASKI